ncbi:MAG: flavodoxin [Candidatus Edwardsbacteria bacterium]|jgi:flavodoxin|nr:flavodoxin [Candidatus Edwardsbacteria bacterium]
MTGLATILSLLAIAFAPALAQQKTAVKPATNDTTTQGKPMKILVAYYSRTGTTKRVCEELAAAVGADIEQITDTKKRSGVFGYLGGGRDAVRKSQTVIGPLKHDPAQYDLVVLASPVWGAHIAPALRTYLAQHKGKIKRAAFLCTMGGSGDAGTFADMKELTGLEPATQLTLLQRDVKKGAHAAKLKEFADKLK